MAALALHRGSCQSVRSGYPRCRHAGAWHDARWRGEGVGPERQRRGDRARPPPEHPASLRGHAAVRRVRAPAPVAGGGNVADPDHAGADHGHRDARLPGQRGLGARSDRPGARAADPAQGRGRRDRLDPGPLGPAVARSRERAPSLVSPFPEASLTPHEAEPVADAVRRAQRGDVDAFETIYHASAPAVFALCRRMTGDDCEARELVQDVFVRAWERLATFRGESALATWLHRLAVNLVLERLREPRRDAARLIEGDDSADPLAPGAAELDARLD